jgi:hypothetical protein
VECVSFCQLQARRLSIDTDPALIPLAVEVHDLNRAELYYDVTTPGYSSFNLIRCRSLDSGSTSQRRRKRHGQQSLPRKALELFTFVPATESKPSRCSIRTLELPPSVDVEHLEFLGDNLCVFDDHLGLLLLRAEATTETDSGIHPVYVISYASC